MSEREKILAKIILNHSLLFYCYCYLNLNNIKMHRVNYFIQLFSKNQYTYFLQAVVSFEQGWNVK